MMDSIQIFCDLFHPETAAGKVSGISICGIKSRILKTTVEEYPDDPWESRVTNVQFSVWLQYPVRFFHCIYQT